MEYLAKEYNRCKEITIVKISEYHFELHPTIVKKRPSLKLSKKEKTFFFFLYVDLSVLTISSTFGVSLPCKGNTQIFCGMEKCVVFLYYICRIPIVRPPYLQTKSGLILEVLMRTKVNYIYFKFTYSWIIPLYFLYQTYSYTNKQVYFHWNTDQLLVGYWFLKFNIPN